MPKWALFLTALAFGALSAFSPSPALAQKRVALVIGNDGYQNIPALKKAINDANR